MPIFDVSVFPRRSFFAIKKHAAFHFFCAANNCRLNYCTLVIYNPMKISYPVSHEHNLYLRDPLASQKAATEPPSSNLHGFETIAIQKVWVLYPENWENSSPFPVRTKRATAMNTGSGSDRVPSPDNNYKIVKSQFPIACLMGRCIGHNMLVLIDSEGRFVREMDGLATNKDGEIIPLGYRTSDKLFVYEFSTPYLYKISQPQTVIFRGSETDAMAMWSALRATGQMINKKKLPYPFLGLGKNSNSTASTLISTIGCRERNIPDGGWTPGTGEFLLTQAEMNQVRREHKVPACELAPRLV